MNQLISRQAKLKNMSFQNGVVVITWFLLANSDGIRRIMDKGVAAGKITELSSYFIHS